MMRFLGIEVKEIIGNSWDGDLALAAPSGDIFHYLYAILHHPEYRERYAANLRRELPRIPLASATPACHPEEAESSDSPRTPEEGPVHVAGSTDAADESIGPFDKLRASSSARKERGPQDDKAVGMQTRARYWPVSSFRAGSTSTPSCAMPSTARATPELSRRLLLGHAVHGA
jgi:hypothetical protein